MSAEPTRATAMFLIIDHGNVRGLTHWCDDLAGRGIPAVIQTNEWMLDEHWALLKSLCDRGFEICGAYNQEPFWGLPYASQLEIMERIKNKQEARLGRPMRLFGSKYSAYNEDTLKAADKLGVKYVFARGAAGARAVIYKPVEYDATLISVSNVPSEKLGTGSLCDQSLWCRGVSPDEFKETLFNLREDRFVLVAQTHLSGVKLHWWNAYRDFLDADLVRWASLDEFVTDPQILPNAQIPMNTEMQYDSPQPLLPLELETEYPFEQD